ncbi:MAG: S8 family serine peptidase [Burkholderiaceae bacterium]|nr:S8 family serine peptidase [Burkholderiaceae bacterium]
MFVERNNFSVFVRYILCLLLPFVVVACVSVHDASLDIKSNSAPHGSQFSNSTNLASQFDHPERLIVVAVNNSPSFVDGRAGSSVGGYGKFRVYSGNAEALELVQAIAKEYGLREVTAWPIDVLNMHCVVMEVMGNSSIEITLEALTKDQRVRLAQPLQTFNTQGAELAPSSPLANRYNDPYAALQHGLWEIDAPSAQRVASGKEIRVAIIDTGMDFMHPDLVGRVTSTQNFVDQDAVRFKQDLHGTGVAGVIAAKENNAEGIVGIAPNVQIVSLKACWKNRLEGQSGSLCNSFTLAKSLVAALDAKVHIINLSLGGPTDPLLTQLLQVSIKKGIIIIASVPSLASAQRQIATNTGGARPSGFPSDVPGVIAVQTARAIGTQKKPANDLANDAAANDVLFAPGDNILTLTPGGSYDFVSGSSFAAAHVTGAVALLLEKNSKLDGKTLFALLNQTSDADQTYARVINICRALNALSSFGASGKERIATSHNDPQSQAPSAKQICDVARKSL